MDYQDSIKLNNYVFGLLQCLHGIRGLTPQRTGAYILPFFKVHLDNLSDNCNMAMPTRISTLHKTNTLKTCAKDLANLMTLHYRKLEMKFIDSIIMLYASEETLVRATRRAIQIGRKRWGKKLRPETITDFHYKLANKYQVSYQLTMWQKDLEKTEGLEYMKTEFAEYDLDTSFLNRAQTPRRKEPSKTNDKEKTTCPTSYPPTPTRSQVDKTMNVPLPSTPKRQTKNKNKRTTTIHRRLVPTDLEQHPTTRTTTEESTPLHIQQTNSTPLHIQQTNSTPPTAPLILHLSLPTPNTDVNLLNETLFTPLSSTGDTISRTDTTITTTAFNYNNVIAKVNSFMDQYKFADSDILFLGALRTTLVKNVQLNKLIVTGNNINNWKFKMLDFPRLVLSSEKDTNMSTIRLLTAISTLPGLVKYDLVSLLDFDIHTPPLNPPVPEPPIVLTSNLTTSLNTSSNTDTTCDLEYPTDLSSTSRDISPNTPRQDEDSNLDHNLSPLVDCLKDLVSETKTIDSTFGRVDALESIAVRTLFDPLTQIKAIPQATTTPSFNPLNERRTQKDPIHRIHEIADSYFSETEWEKGETLDSNTPNFL